MTQNREGKKKKKIKVARKLLKNCKNRKYMEMYCWGKQKKCEMGNEEIANKKKRVKQGLMQVWKCNQ